MKYLLLLTSDPDADGVPKPGSPQEAAEMQQWFDVTAEMEAAGVLAGGDALLPPDTATTVQVRNGKTTTTDGPFAETKEQIGGYYLIDVEDLDAATEWAAKLPNAPYGSVEIRPVMQLPEG